MPALGLRDPGPFEVHHPQHVLSTCKALLGGLHPDAGLGEILTDSITLQIVQSKIRLRRAVALFGGAPGPV